MWIFGYGTRASESQTGIGRYNARMVAPRGNIPTILAAFGATGDWMRRKVLPTLFYLHELGELPDMFRIVGFSRRDLTDETFRDFVQEALEKHRGKSIPKRGLATFLKRFYFQRGDFDETESYASLKCKFDAFDAEWGVCANKMFYFAVAPEFYDVIFRNIAATKLDEPCGPDGGWTRVMVEKPFGLDSNTAKRLDLLLSKYFKEEQIYRIDHYLAKEMLQNILTFRFANNLFEIGWGNRLIEKVEIKLLEDLGVEKRGSFYDTVGAFRDVGQNHFLQVLALLTMQHPRSFDASAIQDARADVLETLPKLSKAQVASATVRGQHEGYRAIDGVNPKSMTDTFFNIKTELKHPNWKGVPIYMAGGKRLGKPQKEIIITLKHPKPCLCPADGPHHKNLVIIRLEPTEEILIEFWSKRPGYSTVTEPRMFHFLFREPSARVQYVEEYARLFLDCIRGDQTLFISTREVKAMWRFADAIVDAWEDGAVPLHMYKPDTKDILERIPSTHKK